MLWACEALQERVPLAWALGSAKSRLYASRVNVFTCLLILAVIAPAVSYNDA